MLDREFLRGGIIFTFCFGVANVLNFIFHLSMARTLDVADYGLLATLLSIIYLLAIISESVQTLVSKHASNAKEGVGGIMHGAMRSMLKPTLILFVIYLVVAVPLSRILDIPYLLISLNGLMIFGSFYMPITRGLLQGKRRFIALGGNMVLESVAKLAISLVLVFIGFKVYGAIIGGLLGAAFAYVISFLNLRPIVGDKGKQGKKIEYSFDKHSFLSVFSIMTFFAIDVVIARFVFEAEIAGAYAIISTIAKTIFFGAMPLGKAMFSFTAEKARRATSRRVFINALVLIAAGIVAALALFYFWPHLWISIFSGKSLPVVESSLAILGVAYSILTVTNLVLLYKVSKGPVKRLWLILLMPVIEIALLTYFSDSVFQFSMALVAASALFLWSSLMSDY